MLNMWLSLSNRIIKTILRKAAGISGTQWSSKLDDACWTYRTAYKTPFGISPYCMVFGKGCHLPVELEHSAYWAVSRMNYDWDQARQARKLRLQEDEEIRLEAYDNAAIYKKKLKSAHDEIIQRKEFEPGQLVLLYQSHFKLMSGKLTTKWCGPYAVEAQHPNGAVEIRDVKKGLIFKVNGQRLKAYYGQDEVYKEGEEVPDDEET